MRKQGGWLATLAALATLSTADCTAVECPAGSVEQDGLCVEPLAESEAGDAAVGVDAGLTEAAANGGVNGGRAANAGGTAGIGSPRQAGKAGSGAAPANAVAGSSGGAGVGGGAGKGGGNANENGGNPAPRNAGEACADPGSIRCSPVGAGNRESCTSGVWTTDAACPTGQTCSADASGKPSCVAVEALCRANGGQAVCDAQGSLIICQEDETIGTQMHCASARHCEAGKAIQMCALCLPREEFRCTDASLEVCDADGMSFMTQEDCKTAGLCNKMLGKCTDAVCDPVKPSCDGNSLVICNADGTAITSTTPCDGGTCDAKGGDCNRCEPGAKTCDAGMVATCDSTGQAYTSTACPTGNTCIGLGQCVECDGPDDCSKLTMDCKVGRCGSGNRCVEQNAPNAMACTTSGRPGTCSNGTCECTKQCSGKQCGSDGCSGECGPCSKICTNSGRCVECENDGDCPNTFTCSNSNTCVCSSGNICEGQCIARSQCCTPSDCSGSNVSCNSSHQCVCESSNFRQCASGGCVRTNGCCSGDSGRSCTTASGSEGKCDSSGGCVEPVCDSTCANSLYKPCSQCTGKTSCSFYEVCTINCSSSSDCPGGTCDSGQCRRACTGTGTSNCLDGTICSGGFCAWNGNG